MITLIDDHALHPKDNHVAHKKSRAKLAAVFADEPCDLLPYMKNHSGFLFTVETY